MLYIVVGLVGFWAGAFIVFVLQAGKIDDMYYQQMQKCKTCLDRTSKQIMNIINNV